MNSTISGSAYSNNIPNTEENSATSNSSREGKTEARYEAQRLYFTESLTQKDIAARVGVSERSIRNWISDYAWDKLKLASLQAPAIIAENFCSQLVELQNLIAARGAGSRFPTPQEAETQRKIMACIEKSKRSPTKAQSLQLFRQFKDWMRNKNNPKQKDFIWDLCHHYNSFMEAEAKNGYAPYEMEYGADKISPLSPFLDADPETANNFRDQNDTMEFPNEDKSNSIGQRPMNLANTAPNKTGDNFSQEIPVDNHPDPSAVAENPSLTASQPLPVAVTEPEITGNLEMEPANNVGAGLAPALPGDIINADVYSDPETANNFPDQNDAMEFPNGDKSNSIGQRPMNLADNSPNKTGNNFHQEIFVDNHPDPSAVAETPPPTASQPLPVSLPQPEKTGKPVLSGAEMSSLVREFLQENKDAIPAGETRAFEQFMQQVFRESPNRDKSHSIGHRPMKRTDNKAA